MSPLITANSASSAIHSESASSAEHGDNEGSGDGGGFYGAAATAMRSPTMTPGRPMGRRKTENTTEPNKCVSNKDSENYFDLVRTSEIRSIVFPLWIVWFASGFAYYGTILFVARLYSTTTDDGESCSFDYSSIFINATAEVGRQLAIHTYIHRYILVILLRIHHNNPSNLNRTNTLMDPHPFKYTYMHTYIHTQV
jgi:hypothetical protein